MGDGHRKADVREIGYFRIYTYISRLSVLTANTLCCAVFYVSFIYSIALDGNWGL